MLCWQNFFSIGKLCIFVSKLRIWQVFLQEKINEMAVLWCQIVNGSNENDRDIKTDLRLAFKNIHEK